MKKNQILSFFLALSIVVGMMAVPVSATGTRNTNDLPDDAPVVETVAPSAAAETDSAETASAETASAETDGEGSAETAETASTETGSAETDDPDASTEALIPTSEKLQLATGAATFDEVEANAALLIDENTYTVLYEQNADTRVAPASLVKVMTALLVFEAIDRGDLTLDTLVTIDSTVKQGLPSDGIKQDLEVGEKMSVEDLLYCLLVASANDAANALAVAVSGSIEDFVADMNAKADDLGCTDTNFTNPTGLDDENMYSTCYDLYYIAEAAWQYEEFRTIVDTSEYYTQPTNYNDERHFYNTNPLLSEKKMTGFTYKYATGIKTGSSDDAGYCLLAAAEYDGRTLFTVVMGCENGVDETTGETTRPVYTETARLFRHGFRDFNAYTIVKSTELISQIPVTLGKDTDFVLVSPENDVSVEMIAGVAKNSFTREIHVPDSVEAPISAGDVLGTMDLYYEGELKATVNLVAVSDVDLSLTDQSASMLSAFFGNIFVRVLLVILGIALVAAIVVVISSFSRANQERYRGTRRQNTPGKKAGDKKSGTKKAAAKTGAKKKTDKKSGSKK